MGSQVSQIVHQQSQFSITVTRLKQSLQVDIRGTAQFAQTFDSMRAFTYLDQFFTVFYLNNNRKEIDFLIKNNFCRDSLRVEKWSIAGGWAWMGFYFLCASFELLLAHQDWVWEMAGEIIAEYSKKLISLQQEAIKDWEQLKMIVQRQGITQEL